MAMAARRTQSARDTGPQHEPYLFARVNFNTPALASSGRVYVGVLPADAYPYETVVRVNTAFDQPIVIGTLATTNAYAQRLDITFGTTGTYHIDRVASLAYSSVDLPIYVMASTVPTVGQADIWVKFLPAK